MIIIKMLTEVKRTNAWTKWEVQQKENIKKYKTETMELKNMTIELKKKSLEGFNIRQD